MGYPRSGHTLVASILNANPNVMCSNQQNIYGDVKNKTFDGLMKEIKDGSNRGYFKKSTRILHVPKQEITVMGDKTGHRTVEVLRNNPRKLGMMKSLVGVPIKWIHVVRNPYDNIATWARLNYKNRVNGNIKKELNDCINKYIELNETIAKLKRSEDILTVTHEFVITRMHNTLEEMAKFLEISFDPQWRDNVRHAVWNKPRVTRRSIHWGQKQRGRVQEIISTYDWLKGYEFSSCGGCGRRRKK